jgi:hypothetical protein
VTEQRLTKIRHHFNFLIIQLQVKLKKGVKMVLKLSMRDEKVRRAVERHHTKISTFLK